MSMAATAPASSGRSAAGAAPRGALSGALDEAGDLHTEAGVGEDRGDAATSASIIGARLAATWRRAASLVTRESAMASISSLVSRPWSSRKVSVAWTGRPETRLVGRLARGFEARSTGFGPWRGGPKPGEKVSRR